MKAQNVLLNRLMISSVLATLYGCSSAPTEPLYKPLEISSDNPEYRIRGRYPIKTPEWALDFETFKRVNDGKGLTYYRGESGEVVNRIGGCELATLNAKRRIATQIAEIVMVRTGASQVGTLSINKDSPDSSDLGSHFQDIILSESMAQLTGVQQYAVYWEERDYSTGGGRKSVIQCEAVVTIDDAHLKEALNKTIKRVKTLAADAQAKKLVDSSFDRLDHVSSKATQEDTE